MGILSLPVELQQQILHNLAWHEHFLVATVCPLWASILQTTPFRQERYFERSNFWAIGSTEFDSVLHGLLATDVLALEVHRDGACNTLLRIRSDNANYTQQDVGSNDARSAVLAGPMYSDWWTVAVGELAATPGPKPKKTRTRVIIDITNSPLLHSDSLLRDKPGRSNEAVERLPDGLTFTFSELMLSRQGERYLPHDLFNDTKTPLLLWKERDKSIAEFLATVKEHMIEHVFKSEERIVCLWVVFRISDIITDHEMWDVQVPMLLKYSQESTV
ncbi:hypothetical protein TWF281_009812 [Arthrobotrys megalospora]